MNNVTALPPHPAMFDALAMATVLRAAADRAEALDPRQHPAAFREALHAIGEGVVDAIGEYAVAR